MAKPRLLCEVNLKSCQMDVALPVTGEPTQMLKLSPWVKVIQLAKENDGVRTQD